MRGSIGDTAVCSSLVLSRLVLPLKEGDKLSLERTVLCQLSCDDIAQMTAGGGQRQRRQCTQKKLATRCSQSFRETGDSHVRAFATLAITTIGDACTHIESVLSAHCVQAPCIEAHTTHIEGARLQGG